MSTYILQKDLPDAKAGTLYEEGKGGKYIPMHGTTPSMMLGINCYDSDFVKNNPAWFKKVEKMDMKDVDKRGHHYLQFFNQLTDGRLNIDITDCQNIKEVICFLKELPQDEKGRWVFGNILIHQYGFT